MPDETSPGDSKQCELCGGPVDGTHKVTHDGHPEGPNHLIGDCCVESDSDQNNNPRDPTEDSDA